VQYVCANYVKSTIVESNRGSVQATLSCHFFFRVVWTKEFREGLLETKLAGSIQGIA
jgi:hypothetical protein